MMERGEVDDATGCESILKVIPVMSLAQTRGRSRAARQHLSSGRWTIEPTKDMPGKSTLRRTISISIAPIRYHPFGVPSDPNKNGPRPSPTDLTHRCIPFTPMRLDRVRVLVPGNTPGLSLHGTPGRNVRVGNGCEAFSRDQRSAKWGRSPSNRERNTRATAQTTSAGHLSSPT